MIADFTPTSDQTLIVESIESVLSQELPVERLRSEGSSGGAAERAMWDKLVDLGLFGLGLAEALGGTGYGLAEEALASRALGPKGQISFC